jgi:hypothetical protein
VQQKETKHFFEIFKNKIIIHKGKFLEFENKKKTKNFILFDVREVKDKGIRIIEIENLVENINKNGLSIFLNFDNSKKIFFFDKKLKNITDNENYNSIVNNFFKHFELKIFYDDDDKNIEFLKNIFKNDLEVHHDLENENEIEKKITKNDFEKIEKLKNLLEKKILTEEEFFLKKEEILKIYKKSRRSNTIINQNYHFEKNEIIKLPEIKENIRLFQLTSITGTIEYIEFYDFNNDDLDERDVFLLTTPDNLYIWIGKKSNHNLIKFSLEFSVTFSNFLNKKPLIVKDLCESDKFKLYFHNWEYNKKFLNFLKKENDKEIEEILKIYQKKTYSYNELLSDKLPNGIDETKLETYLSENEFFDVFNISRFDFEKLKEFKQIELKKSVYLY